MTKNIPLSKDRFAIVDDEDYEQLIQYKWQGSDKYYAYRFDNGTKVYMHRYIINPPAGFVVDHIDGNRLNNTRENLRAVSPADNLLNQGLSRKNKSGFKGVYFHKGRNCWRAEIRKMHLGYFENIQDAASAYEQAKMKLVTLPDN